LIKLKQETIMKMKTIAYTVAALGLTAFASSSAIAGGTTNNAVHIGPVGDFGVLNASNGGAASALSATIKTSEQKDLVMGVSLECGLYTRTEVKGKKGQTSTSNASTSVEVAVILDKGTADARVAAPGWVTFCSREQELSATLGDVLESCDVSITENADGTLSGAFDKDDCEFSDEMISLMLKTMNANHYNFILTDVGTYGAGGHTVDVMVRTSSETSGSTIGDDGMPLLDENGESVIKYNAGANAILGNGSLVVDEVRLAKELQLEGAELGL
jgi:hypothetical protein